MAIGTVSCLLLAAGCANVSTSKFTFSDGDKTVSVEIPKEIVARNLKVEIDAQNGKASVSADEMISSNQETIAAQASRESKVLQKSSDLVGKVTEGAVKGAVKGVVPSP